ncbi:cysteine-rich and transmembrane domain-containing protein WIH2 [Oryza sativa Japonica Group]|uniref:Uncharacterized protein n=1 Tax=Oryza sativa subsp. japonica TaxID=39947 RepID=A3BQM3_ORYSJ|nr:cysteine-rich and transmembrane domain-containing protein WIH2 [Oryza sativa Japonica Group]EAZ41862.1 hypothetical protein OsJ_26407 [Oryza sativa Japonica Group]
MSYQTPPPAATGYPYPAQEAGQQQQQAYPAYVAPPPAGYPTKDGPQEQYPAGAGAGETTSRGHHHHHHHGDGFWKGCCAALCCCCLLDMCF